MTLIDNYLMVNKVRYLTLRKQTIAISCLVRRIRIPDSSDKVPYFN